jgi:hypothetical protein
MELVEAHSWGPDVEDVTPNDVKWGYYCRRLVDHLQLRPFDVLTSSGLEIEMRLVIIGNVETLHDVGALLLSPLTKLGITQESAKFSNFANYKFQEIASTSSFTNDALHLELVLQKIPRISNWVNVSCQEDITILGFPKGDV